MHIFTFSESWGPFKCEVDGCVKEAWSVVLTDEDYLTLPETHGSAAAEFIIRTKLGTAMCNKCIKHMPH